MRFKDIINSRLHGNIKQNWLSICHGATGSGKSFSSLGIAYQLNPDFDVDHNVVFSLKDFVTKLKNKEFKQGDIIVYEEAGTSLDSREWQSKANKLMVYIVQTFRPQRLGMIFTLPQLRFLDNRIRTGVHCYLKPFKIDRVNKTNHVRPYFIDYNEDMDKIYRKYPVIRDNLGRKTKISQLIIPLAPKKIIDVYEQRREEFSNKLIEDIHNDIMEMGKPKKSLQQQAAEKNKEIIEKVRLNPDTYMRPTSKGQVLDVSTLMYEFDLGRSKAYDLKRQISKLL